MLLVYPSKRASTGSSITPIYFSLSLYIGIDHTIECIKNEWIKYGPFDGLLGFSQGAVMAHIITSLKKNCDSQKYSWLQSLRFGIFVAGFPSRMIGKRNVPKKN